MTRMPVPSGIGSSTNDVEDNPPWIDIPLFVAWVQASVATFGSLYFSEVMNLLPCVLCWYQRIFMYPLAILLAVGIWRRNSEIHLYALPLSVVGLGISIYHNLLYYGVIPEAIQPCTSGVSCTTRQIEWLGFITIPLMALTAFSIVSVSLLTHVFLLRESTDE